MTGPAWFGPAAAAAADASTWAAALELAGRWGDRVLIASAAVLVWWRS